MVVSPVSLCLTSAALQLMVEFSQWKHLYLFSSQRQQEPMDDPPLQSWQVQQVQIRHCALQRGQ